MRGFSPLKGGFAYAVDWRQVAEGDKVMLVREPANPYDPHAVRVDHPEVGTIGYLDRHLALQVFWKLDDGYPWACRVASIQPGYDRRIALEIWVGQRSRDRIAGERRVP